MTDSGSLTNTAEKSSGRVFI